MYGMKKIIIGGCGAFFALNVIGYVTNGVTIVTLLQQALQ